MIYFKGEISCEIEKAITMRSALSVATGKRFSLVKMNNAGLEA